MKQHIYKGSLTKTLSAVAVAAALGISSTALASNNDGALKGSIFDSSSNTALAGATVTITNPKTGYSRTITVNDDGSYRFSSLPVGEYTLLVQKEGYSQTEEGNVRVRLADTAIARIGLTVSGMEVIEVRGSNVASIDVTSSESALNIGELELDRIPTPRNVTGVALLAPSTVQGDTRVGLNGSNLAAFGGSSIAENTMYINGLNVTNFRNGLGFSTVPFEFYKEFQVKTGGYSAEFGRSTGGVVNAVTKSGSNEFEFGADIYWTPNALRETSPDSWDTVGQAVSLYSRDESDNINGNIWASGALIEDSLFYYVMYNPRDNSSTLPSYSSLAESSSDDAFWGAKVDWHINDDHSFELLAFSDSNAQIIKSYGYDWETNTRGVRRSTAANNSGGDNWSIKYTGYITDDFTISALYGVNKYDLSSTSDLSGTCNLILERRAGYTPTNNAGCATTSDYFLRNGDDERRAMRIDFEWALGDHLIRGGMDNEDNSSFSEDSYSGPGGAYWLLNDAAPGTQIATNIYMPDDYTEYARARIRTVSGSFSTKASAFYIEDIWTATEDLTLTLGLRVEEFDNRNSNGETFVKISNMIAPRLGASWDINGDGDSKLFANVGRYFLPVASNTNVRLSGNEDDVYYFYGLDGTSQGEVNGIPNLNIELGPLLGTQVNAAGVVPDTRVIVADNIEPMYQDEIILGYQAAINEDWTWGVRGIRRVMDGAIDDMLIDHATVARYGCGHVDHNYVLGNPGVDMDVWLDTDCDNVPDSLETLSAEELGYPVAERKYNAMEFTLAKVWDDVWSLNASYTWAQSYGNSEGLVSSDGSTQSDAGITANFDFPALSDGSYGYLANDRRHSIKVYGSYAITEDLIVGMNFNLTSGRPINALGTHHPTMDNDYGNTFWTCDPLFDDGNCDDISAWTKNNRGTFGRTPWVATLDLSANYSMQLAGSDVELRANVFNVFNAQSVLRVNEFSENSFAGDINPQFNLPTAFQRPRSVQFSASVRF